MKLGPISDPNLLGLLREISADPKSRLMKIATQGVDTHIGLREAPLSEGEPFLTRAERHLLREHREQVAFLLFKAGQRAIDQAPPLEHLAYRGSFLRDSIGIPSEDWLAQELSASLSTTPSDPEALRFLIATESTNPMEPPGGLGSSSAAHRLLPRDSTRNQLALALLTWGHKQDGVNAMNEVVSPRSTSLYRSIATQNLAFGHLENDQALTALEMYRESARATPSRPEPLLGWLHSAILNEDWDEAMTSAALAMEATINSVEGFLNEHILIWNERKRVGLFRPNSKQSSFATKIESRLPEGVARIASIFSNGGTA